MEKVIIGCSFILLALAAAGLYTDLSGSWPSEDRPDNGMEAKKNYINQFLRESDAVATLSAAIAIKPENSAIKRKATMVKRTQYAIINDLVQYANQNGVLLEEESNRKAVLNSLQKMNNRVKDLGQLLQQELNSFEQVLNNITDPELVKWLQQTIPQVKNDLLTLQAD